MKLKPTIISHGIVLSLSALASEAYPGELIYGCAVTPKEWEGDYMPWTENTKNAHSHLTFDDGPFIGDTEVILDVLKEYNTKATFFLLADNMNEDTRYIVDRIIDEGHMIGSHTNTHRNLQYGNQTVLEEEIVEAHNFFKEYLGFQPKIFRPPYGSIDDRSHKLLEEYGYSIVMWSSGCVDWWFTGNDKDLETSTAAMRYSQAEMGSIVCMHDTAQAPNKGERLRKFLDDTWDLWNYVDFDTCINRTDVDEGMVFKTYTEYKRAVAEEAAKLVADDDDLHAQDQESDEPVTPALRGSVFVQGDMFLNEETEDAPCLEPGERCDPEDNQCCMRGGSDKCEASPWSPNDYFCR